MIVVDYHTAHSVLTSVNILESFLCQIRNSISIHFQDFFFLKSNILMDVFTFTLGEVDLFADMSNLNYF